MSAVIATFIAAMFGFAFGWVLNGIHADYANQSDTEVR